MLKTAHFFHWCFLLLFVPTLPAQTGRAYEKRAAETYAARDFANALPCYQVLLDADSTRHDLNYRGGVSAMQLKIFKLAERWFARIPDSLKTGELDDTDLLLGLTFKGMGRYDEAIDAFFRYIENHPTGDKKRLSQANAEIESCQWAKAAMLAPTPIRIERLPERLNSAAADFAPVRFSDRLYFTHAGATDSLGDPLPTRVVSSANGESPLPSHDFLSGNEPGIHIANYATSLDAQRIFFSRCRETGIVNELQCEIWQSDRSSETGEWQKPRKLPPAINPEGTSNTQPSLGWDNRLAANVLYFISNRPGGVGGRDVWSSVLKEDGSPAPPVCLSLNSPQDEATPSFHQASQTLFFASNGGRNFGGYDVFFTKKTNGADWDAPKNMGFPINSSYDDLYFSFHSPSRSAYFSSNRPGGTCSDPNGNCTCQDLYRALMRTGLEVNVFSELDSAALYGAKVELTDLRTGRLDTFYVNPNDNRFTFALELERSYRIRASCPRYMSATTEVSTEGVTYFDFIKKDLYLTPGAVLAVRTYNAIDKERLGGVKIELTDGKTGQVRVNQNGEYYYRYDFRMEFDRQYHILATLPEYASASTTINTESLVEGDTIYADLFLSPFRGLPLTLFFDNGQPAFINPEDTATLLTYGETISAYYGRKEVFLKGYTAGLKTKNQRQQARSVIEAFFADSVQANYERLYSFCPLLLTYLADTNFNHRIEVLFAGYASPLGDSISNKRLTARRVSSVINEFRAWNGGSLVPYLDEGRLQINLDPRGEETDDRVSDDPGNLRSSVFSPEASTMRRVVITQIRTLEPEGEKPGRALPSHR